MKQLQFYTVQFKRRKRKIVFLNIFMGDVIFSMSLTLMDNRKEPDLLKHAI